MRNGKDQCFEPELWLICSSAALKSIVGHWSEEAGSASLLRWRLAHGLIEHVDRSELADRLVLEAAERDGPIAILFDDIGESELSLAEAVPASTKAGFGLQIIDWRSSPIDAVIEMNGLDSAVLRRLEDGGRSTDIRPLQWPARYPAAVRKSYRAALQAWETGCRADYPEDFAAAFPSHAETPIDWTALIVDRPIPAAANDDWLFIGSAAAGSTPDDGTPFRLEAPPESPDRWDLTWAPKDLGAAGYLIFTCHPASTSSLIGCRVQIRSKGETFDLGVVENDGIAQLLVGQRVDVGDVWVSILRQGVD